MRTHSEPSKQSRHKRYVAAVVAIATIATLGGAGGPVAAAPTNMPEGSGVDTAPVARESASSDIVAAAATTDTTATASTGPQLLDDAVGDLVVRLHGGVCSGTPITGTVYVVTAAHCVLTESGEVTQRTIVRDYVRYTAVAVLVDTDYHDHPSAELDAAVLIMDQVIPGPSARVGVSLPDSGQVTLAGFQPVDTDRSLLRGHTIHDHPIPKGATGTRIDIPYRPAGCVNSVDTLDVSVTRVMVPCGLVPGASGGGLYNEDDGEFVLVGILSTVTADLSANGIVPLASLHELLEHPDRYAHGFQGKDAQDEWVRSERR